MKKQLLFFITLVLCLVSISLNAQMYFEKNFGGDMDEYGYDLIQTSDDCFLMVGSTTSYGAGNEDLYVVKTNMYGDTIWTKTYGGAEYEVAQSVAEVEGAGYIIVGATMTDSQGGKDWYILRIDADGNVLWDKTLGTTGNDRAHRIWPLANGNFIIVGNMFGLSSNGTHDIKMMEITSTGNILWQKLHDYGTHEYGYDIIETIEGNFVIAGKSVHPD